VWIRRGLRAALVQVVPIGALYAVWWIAYGRHNDAPRRPGSTVTEKLTFVERALRSTVLAFAGYRVAAVALVVVVAVGVVLLATTRRTELRTFALPIALAVGSLIFLSITAVGRAGPLLGDAEKSRYLHIALALLLPGLAVALDAVARRWPVLVVPLAVLLLVGVPANLSDVHELGREPFDGNKRDVLVLADSDAIRTVPATFRPFGRAEERITAGWLRDGRASGRIPRPALGTTKLDEANAYDTVALSPLDITIGRPCRPGPTPGPHTYRPGEEIRFRGLLAVRTRRAGGVRSGVRRFRSDRPARVQVRAPVEVSFEAKTRTVCLG
jgi:hypothetical protein